MAKIKYKLYVDHDPTRTVALQSKKTGRFYGRRTARKGEKSDKILNIRVREPESESGQVRGFLPAGKTRIPVKGNARARGYSRSSL